MKKPKSTKKHAPKRTEFQIVNDRRIIAERYLKGHRQSDIAFDLGISRQQVGYDLDVIRKIWREETVANFDEAKSVELAKIDRLEREAWRAWECEPPETTKTETRKRNVKLKGENKVTAEARKAVLQLKARDPRYLQIVGDCIDRRRKVFGFDAPTKIAPTNPEGDKPLDMIATYTAMIAATQAAMAPAPPQR